jgi:CheY-like chemotaxis protein
MPARSKINDVSLMDIAVNGKDALVKLRKAGTLPSMIFMDVNMPLVNGLECLSGNRQRSENQYHSRGYPFELGYMISKHERWEPLPF